MFHRSKSFEVNPSKRFIGVEIELAGTNDADLIKNAVNSWNGEVGSDGSIRLTKNPNVRGCCLEIKTAPANGDKFVKQLLDIGDSLRESQAVINNSCGVHVHVDARDFKEKHLDNLLVLWYKIEPSMFELVKPVRRTNTFCKAHKFPKPDIKVIKERLNADGESNDDDYCCNSCNGPRDEWRKKRKNKKGLLSKLKNEELYLERYRSLNLLPLSDLGTVENRMYHGTTKRKDIINWGILNASILDFAKEHSMDEILKMKKSMKTLMSIAPNRDMVKWMESKKKEYSAPSTPPREVPGE